MSDQNLKDEERVKKKYKDAETNLLRDGKILRIARLAAHSSNEIIQFMIGLGYNLRKKMIDADSGKCITYFEKRKRSWRIFLCWVFLFALIVLFILYIAYIAYKFYYTKNTDNTTDETLYKRSSY